MGILNVTPDSFSDGGRFEGAEAAVEEGARLFDEGADVIDVGGESTRPGGAVAVSTEEELLRVIPVLTGLSHRRPDAVLSVDTVKSAVATAAIDAGAHIVNDVSGFRLDPRMGEICARARAGVVLMHSRGSVSEMGTYALAQYGDDDVGEVLQELEARVAAARAAGVADACIAVDPGIGFAKRSETSLRMLAALPRLATLGFPIVVGASRKRFIGEITGVTDPARRMHGTVGASVAALALGARIFRVHDVAAHRQALDVAWAILRQTGGATVKARGAGEEA